MLLNGEATEIEAGKNMKFDMESELLLAGRVVLAPTEGGKITFTNLNRAGGAPSYRGTIELLRTDTGILVVNELSIDEYLYSVLPSEMPVSYGVEALKVQAVCARSYAYMQVMSNGLAKLGAHVDDSTSYQVYNNTPETAESIEAVNLTAGQVLTYEGDIVPAYYFSTSAGYTANGDEVWLGMKTVPYLQGKLQTTEGTELGEQSDLSNEENFSNFINNQDLVTFDSSFPWYRWNVTIAASDIKSSIENAIAKRYEVNPSLILTKGESGEYECKPITVIGKIKSIKVAQRSS